MTHSDTDTLTHPFFLIVKSRFCTFLVITLTPYSQLSLSHWLNIVLASSSGQFCSRYISEKIFKLFFFPNIYPNQWELTLYAISLHSKISSARAVSNFFLVVKYFSCTQKGIETMNTWEHANIISHQEMQIKTITLNSIAVKKNLKTNKCWWGCEEIRILTHPSWDCKMTQLLWKTLWQVLKTLHTHMT